MKNKHILFAAYGAGHINMLLPVIKYFRQHKEYNVTVLAFTTAGFTLTNNEVDYLSYKDFTHLFDSSKIFEFGDLLSENMKTSCIVPEDETIAYLGINFLELTQLHGFDASVELYNKKGRSCFYPIQSMKRILTFLCPDIVVSTHAPRSERALIGAAGQLSIPSVCLVDLFPFRAYEWLAENGYANKVCVLSEYVKKFLVSKGRSVNDIVVTGNTVFDKLSFYRSTKRKQNSPTTSKNSKTILWASQVEPHIHPLQTELTGNPDLPRDIEYYLYSILKKHPGWKLIIRPHPSENHNYVNLPDNVKISQKTEKIHELISTVDVVITMTSTVAIEAALIGKPVITVDLSIFTKDSPFSEMGLTRGVKRISDLETAIIDAEPSTNMMNSVDKIVGKPGGATKNIIRVIEELLIETSL